MKLSDLPTLCKSGFENKSNDAGDMDFQIPRYYDDLASKGVDVDAMIYLNKDFLKNPKDINKWEKDEIKNKLIISTLNIENGFVQNVIYPVLVESSDIRLSAISLEIESLFENVVNGVYGMSEEKINMLFDLLLTDNTLKNFEQIYTELPNLAKNYYYKKISEKLGDSVTYGKCNEGAKGFYCSIENKNGFEYRFDFHFRDFIKDEIEICLVNFKPKVLVSEDIVQKFCTGFKNIFPEYKFDRTEIIISVNDFKEKVDEICNIILKLKECVLGVSKKEYIY